MLLLKEVILTNITDSKQRLRYYISGIIILITIIGLTEVIIQYDLYAQQSRTPGNVGIKIGGTPYAITVNPSNNKIYVIDKFYKKISIIDGDTDRLIKTRIIASSR